MEKIRWGVMGTGRIVAKAGNGIKRSANGEWLGVAGRNGENSRRAAEQYGVPRAYGSYRELLEDPEIDAVYIALLNHLHCEWAVAALQAGKHVLLEKPFAMTSAEAERIAAAARAGGKLVREAHVWHFYDGFAAAERLVKEGAIGEPGMFVGHFSFTADPASTRWVKEWGGGALYDIGCYPLAWSRFFFDDEPESAVAHMTLSPGGVDERFVGTLRFSGGRTAQISAALNLAGGSGCVLYGSKGKLIVGMTATADELTVIVDSGAGPQAWTSDRITPFVRQAEAFAEAILTGDGGLSDGWLDDALRQTAALDALMTAAREQREVSL